MKNIHILPTDKPSILGRFIDTNNLFLRVSNDIPRGENVNIYITSDEEIKEGDWCIEFTPNNEKITELFKCNEEQVLNISTGTDYKYKKIILTTNQDLIKDGVQEISDEFLEWFVKNPSCESVEIIPLRKSSGWYDEKEIWHWDFLAYKIVIPKEEPKQETPEEAAERLYPTTINSFTDSGFDMSEAERLIFINGAKWQQEQNKNLYSEEEVLKILYDWSMYKIEFELGNLSADELVNELNDILPYDEWFKQNKKK